MKPKKDVLKTGTAAAENAEFPAGPALVDVAEVIQTETDDFAANALSLTLGPDQIKNGTHAISEWGSESVDLDKELEKNADRVSRERALREKLTEECKSGPEALRAFAMSEGGLSRFLPKELLEITNRFRRMGRSEDEVWVYEECGNADYRAIPRVREFYALALMKTKQSGKSIDVLQQIIQDGQANAIVWGTLGDAYTDLSISAEKFGQSIARAGSPQGVSEEHAGFFKANFGIDARSPQSDLETLARFRDMYGVEAPTDQAQCDALSDKCLHNAALMYEQGYGSTSDTFTGTGLLRRLCDRHARLKLTLATGGENKKEVVEEIAEIGRQMKGMRNLNWLSVEKEGGSESLSYWTHASRLELAIHDKASQNDMERILRKCLRTVDVGGKLRNTWHRIHRFATALRLERGARERLGEEHEGVNERIRLCELALRQLDSFATRLDTIAELKERKERSRGNAELWTKDDQTRLDKEESHRNTDSRNEPPRSAEGRFHKKTFSFRHLIDSVLPQYVPGGVSRGGRVPDLMVNRQDSQTMKDIDRRLGLEEETEEWLTIEKADIAKTVSDKMRKALDVVRAFVRTQFKTASLQDLKSKDHTAFDTLSEALIRLSGINPSKKLDKSRREGTRSITNLSAALLAGLGDCREVTYAVGALFTAYQKITCDSLLANGYQALREGNKENYTKITEDIVPEILRYELRGGHVGVYAGIGVKGKYDTERVSVDDPTAKERRVIFGGTQSNRSAATLTDYEFANSVIVATIDGKEVLVQPKAKKDAIPPDRVPVLPVATADWSNVQSVELRNLVEDHTLTFLSIAARGDEPHRVEFADGFYDQRSNELGDDPRYVSPYQFGSGTFDFGELKKGEMLHAGHRVTASTKPGEPGVPVFVRFLDYSKTDYQFSLGEGDEPGKLRLLGNNISAPVGERMQDVDTAHMLFQRGEKGKPNETTNDRALDRVRAWHEEAA